MDALGRFVWTFVRAGRAQSQRKARGNGHRDGARRGKEFRVVAKRARSILSDEIRFGGQQPSADAMGNLQRPSRPERGQEPPHNGAPDAFGDQGVKEPGHHRTRHTWLDATERAGGRVVADDDEQCVGCQVSNVLERVAEVGLDDDRVRLVRRNGIDQRLLRLGDRDDVEPTRSKASLHVAHATRRDHAQPAAARVRPGGRSLWQGETFDDRHGFIGSQWTVVDPFFFGDALSTIERAAGHVARWFYRAGMARPTRP